MAQQAVCYASHSKINQCGPERGSLILQGMSALQEALRRHQRGARGHPSRLHPQARVVIHTQQTQAARLRAMDHLPTIMDRLPGLTLTDKRPPLERPPTMHPLQLSMGPLEVLNLKYASRQLCFSLYHIGEQRMEIELKLALSNLLNFL